jgi:HlyD family secretion protein
VTTVQVGSQVSGTVAELYADFNSIVHKGQVIARLDPSLFQTQIDQQQANLIRSEADLERLNVSLDDAKVKLARAEDLRKRNLISQSDLETAQVAARSAQAQLQSQQAQVTQSRASLNQAKVNLEHTVIAAPIDGIVISRNVDVGQTVAASMQAPTLYVLAADLSKMQVVASIDEADVGRIRPDQVVKFRVDAYPTEEFTGAVSQIRLEPVVVQNVVTYNTVIDVPNPQLKLKPGMTANVTVEIARADNVLRVPASALRFRPTADMFLALNLPVPPELQRGPRAAGATARANPGGRGGGAQMDPAQREQMRARVQGMSAEERQQFFERMRGGQGDDVPARTLAVADAPINRAGASTIDQLFAPLPRRETPGRVWLWAGNQLKPVRVRLGISDGTNTELISNELKPEMEVVTGILLDSSASSTIGGGATGNPLIPQRRGFRR